jgi:hypothetical protein
MQGSLWHTSKGRIVIFCSQAEYDWGDIICPQRTESTATHSYSHTPTHTDTQTHTHRHTHTSHAHVPQREVITSKLSPEQRLSALVDTYQKKKKKEVEEDQEGHQHRLEEEEEEACLPQHPAAYHREGLHQPEAAVVFG